MKKLRMKCLHYYNSRASTRGAAVCQRISTESVLNVFLYDLKVYTINYTFFMRICYLACAISFFFFNFITYK